MKRLLDTDFIENETTLIFIMTNMHEQYDSALIGILQHEGNISPFLDAVMGFLYRRTDFYRIMTHKEAKMGFPPGVAQKILLNAFKKYEDLAAKDEERRERLALREKQTKEREKNTLPEPTDTVPPPAAKIVEVETETTNSNRLTGSEVRLESNQSGDRAQSENSVTSDQSNVKTQTCNGQPDKSSGDDKSVNTVNNTDFKQLPSSSTENQGVSKDGDDDNPELTRLQQLYQSNPESYNGAIRDNYRWSQSILDLDVRVNMPKFIKKGKDVKVVIDKKHLKVSYRTESGDWTVVMDDSLTWEINKEESIWSLVPGEHIHISMDKREERWWEALLASEPKISVRKIDASRPMTDLDDEAQAKIGEMMYNERQKRMGLPTSEEQKVQNVLKDAWNAEGSPFKGTDFDPSKFSVNQGVVTINDDK